MKFVAAVFIASLAGPALAQSMYAPYGSTGTGSNPSSGYVQGYTNHNGTAVQGYERTAPNNTQLDNYNTRGNYNSYTGQTGTRSPRW